MGNTRRIGNSQNRNLGNFFIMGNAANHKIFIFHRIILPYKRTGIGGKSRAHMNGNAEVFAHFYRTGMHNPCAKTGHFQHFMIGNLAHFPSARHDTRVSRIYAIHIREDFTGICLEGTGNGDSGSIGTAAAQSDIIP